MRALALRIVPFALLWAGCGFDVSFSIAMDANYGSFEHDGKPVTYVTIERSYSNIEETQDTDIVFEVSDGAGLHTFELSDYIFCDNDTDPPLLEVSLLLTYRAESPDDGEMLHMLWAASKCNGITIIP